MMNSYLNSDNDSVNYSSSGQRSSEDNQVDIAKREKLQHRHYELLKHVQSMARDLPMQYQQRLPYELLSSLASCLLDDSIFKIVEGLKDIQQITEKSLFEKRQKFVDHYRVKKLKYQKELMDQLTAKEMPYELAKSKEKDFEREMEEAVSKFDMKLMLELDQAVSDQQETLESTGVPGFHVTNNATEIRIQMYIIEFITRLSEL